MKKFYLFLLVAVLGFVGFACSKTVYTIEYDLDGGTCENLVNEFTDALEVKLPTPVKEGYNFKGWFEGEKEVSSLQNKNYSLVAHWEIKVMSYAEYAAAELESPVVVQCYVQAHQSWWADKVTVYAADQDGAYFLYNMACSEADAAKLNAGVKILVKGTKTAWAGEVEIKDATFEFLEGNYVAEALDVTNLLGTEELIKHQNKLVSFKNMVVVASKNADQEDVAWLYKWNGSGAEGDDLYFNVSFGGNVYTFTVESYLCGPGTPAYEAVKNLKIGDIIDLEGFLYWYDGVNPHITSVSCPMTYEQYMAAELETPVSVICYVQAHQSWWADKITVYAADEDGAYFIYNMACSQENAALLVQGAKILVKGTKTAWAGEIEIKDATFILLEGSYVATAFDVTSLLGTDDLIKHQNELVSFKGMTVVASKNADQQDVAWLYKWNGSGSEGDDLYFNVSFGEKVYTFTVESYLCGSGTPAYEAVKNLQIGDVIDLEGFLYWYDGVNPHITSVIVNSQAIYGGR